MLYPVTQDFLQKISADERKVHAKIEIDYTDPFMDQTITAQPSNNARVSYPEQTADAVTEPPHKWISADGSWRPDGTWRVLPSTPTHQVGWWGALLAGADGAFAVPYPKLTVTHFPRPVQKLSVYGDSLRGEWPVNFIIRLYGENDLLLHEEAVTGNGGTHWEKLLSNHVVSVVKQELIITRWSHAGRQAKILEFFTSVKETYEGDDIVLIHLLEEREVSQGSLPVGNISANEIDIRLDNQNRKFDAGNKQSPLYQLLKANRRIRAWLGVDVEGGREYVPLGTFWSADWTAPEWGIYAQTTGRDRLELLRKSTYSTSTVQQDITLYALAVAILQDAGITEDEYWVDLELQNFSVPYAYFDPQSHREALRKIAEACLGQVYASRTNSQVRVEGPSFLAGQTQSVLTLTQDDYFQKDNPVKWSEIANYIEVETQPLRPDVLQEVYRSNAPANINAGQTLNLTVYYNSPPCIDAVSSLEGAPAGCIIQNATYYAWGADITVYSPSNTGTFTLAISAKPLKILNKERAIAKDDASIADNGNLKYTFPANPLVQTLGMAQTIANTLLQSFKDPRRNVEVKWRGNPALLLGDRVAVTDSNEQNDYYVIKQKLEYSGALRANLSGRRAG